VAELYADVRATSAADPAGALRRFRAGRDRLFREHPDSPLPMEARAGFAGIPWWPHDPTLRFEARILPLTPEPLAPEPVAPKPMTATSVGGTALPLLRIGTAILPVGSLPVYWIDVYGGGIFVPFRDATSGQETHAAGRYLVDTIKGADLGGTMDRLVLDFNYAYHPSCAYDPRWSCPLAPPGSRLDLPIRAGERLQAQSAD
jgi:hypothetical protein